MAREVDLENAALGVIRSARRTCEQLGSTGLRLVAVADWLEVQVPRIRAAYQKAVKAAVDELEGSDPPEPRG
jgi:hypothetical protein